MIPPCSRLGSLVLAALLAGPDGASSSVPVPLRAQEDTEASAERVVVSTAPRWEVGERYRLECVKEQEQRDGARRTSWGGTVTPIEVEVLGRDDGGYRLVWRWGPAKALEGTPAPETVESLAAVNDGLVTEFATDEGGVPLRVTNDAEIEAFYAGKLDAVREERGPAAAAQRRALESLCNAAEASLAGPIFLAYARTFYANTGLELALGEPLRWDEPVALPFGGAQVRAVTTVEPVELRARGTQVLCTWRQEVDPAEMARAVEEVLQRLDREHGREPQAAAPRPALEILSEGTFVSDVRTGRPVTAEMRTTITMDGRTRIDVKRFRALPAAAEDADASEPGSAGAGEAGGR